MRQRMGWPLYVAGAVMSWGIYGTMLARGQMHLANPLKALLCVVPCPFSPRRPGAGRGGLLLASVGAGMVLYSRPQS